MLLEPALLDLLPRGETGGGSVLNAVVDSGPPLDRALLGANGALDTNRPLNALALHPLRSRALTLDTLALDSLRSGALALNTLARLRTLGADTLADLRTLGANSRPFDSHPFARLRALGADLLLAALGGFRAGRGALRALLGAIRLLGALLGLCAVATLGVRGSGDCDGRYGGDQECLGHEDFQYRPVAIRTVRKSA